MLQRGLVVSVIGRRGLCHGSSILFLVLLRKSSSCKASLVNQILDPQPPTSLETASNVTRSSEQSGVETGATVPGAESTLKPPESTADTARVRFDASTEANRLEYGPARYRLKEAVRGTLTDPGGDRTGAITNEAVAISDPSSVRRARARSGCR